MKPFKAPSVSLSAPDDWTDGSTYMIYGPETAGGHPSMVVTIMYSGPKDGTRAHVDRQLPELRKLPEFRQERLEALPDLEGVFLQFAWKQPAGPPLRVRQWYLVIEKVLYTLTATAPAAVFEEKQAVFDEMVKGFAAKRW